MNITVDSQYLVPHDVSFRIQDAPTTPPPGLSDKSENKRRLNDFVEELYDLQRVLYAHDRYAILLIFQAMDSAGKDGTIRAVMTGVNPAGCQVFSFKKPSSEELDHDFLWRTTKRLPERGRIGIFNRSYYEEVLIVRVHPDLLIHQKLPFSSESEDFWIERYESICAYEKHLSRNGTVIIKFWLNISKNEQRNRFLSRLIDPEKNWKFSEGDVTERGYWDEYMFAYQEALNTTSKPWAPWYVIPADNKPYMRYIVAKIVVETLRKLELIYPSVSRTRKKIFEELRFGLENEDK